jgi:hypothetical protein
VTVFGKAVQIAIDKGRPELPPLHDRKVIDAGQNASRSDRRSSL